MKTCKLILAASAGLAALSGCLGRGPAVGAARPTDSDSVIIFIVNQNFYDTSIFVQFSGSGRQRLGSVSGQNRRRFAVRWEPGQIRFYVDFVGARFESRSEALILQPNEHVELQIPSTSNRTGNLIIRRR